MKNGSSLLIPSPSPILSPLSIDLIDGHDRIPHTPVVEDDDAGPPVPCRTAVEEPRNDTLPRVGEG